MGRRGGMSGISSLIDQVYPGKGQDDLMARRVFAWWAHGVSPRIAANARPVKLRKGVLTVHTATSAWADSTNSGSLSVVKACSGVFDRTRLTTANSPLGASKACRLGCQ